MAYETGYGLSAVKDKWVCEALEFYLVREKWL